MLSEFKDFIVAVLGEYTPVVFTQDGINIIPAGLAGVDFSYVFAGVIMCICIYSVFKIVGSCICKMF